MKDKIIASVFAWSMFASGCAIDDPSAPSTSEEVQAIDTINGGSRNVKVTCTSGTVTAKAYENNVLVNTQTLTSGQNYCFIHNSSSTLKIEVSWPNTGGHYTWVFC